MKPLNRCSWAESNAALRDYHDTEWGVPEFDSRALWEKLVLDGFQAGLSWNVILQKREAFRKAFRGFDPAAVVRFTARDVDRLVEDAGIVRSRSKIEAAIGNARAYLEIEDFSGWIWDFVGGKPIQTIGPRPVKTDLSEQISKELKERGFKFVGPTIVYAWMQAVGLVNDHADDCFRRRAVKKLARTSN